LTTAFAPAGRTGRWLLAAGAVAVVFCVTIALHKQVLASQDLYLHISVGRWILAHGAIPDHGIFSASMPTAPWVPHEWLAALGFALLYDNLGWGGVLLAIATLMALAIGALVFDITARLGPAGALVAAVLGWGLCINHMVARPHIASLPLVVIWIALHVRARRNNVAPPWYAALLMILWVNLHGAFMFGLAFTALFAAEAVFESDTLREARAQARRWGLFLIAGLLAACVTPLGATGLLFPLRLAGLGPALATVYEWDASSLTNNAPLVAWCFLLLFAALLCGVRLPLCRLIMFLLVLYMAVSHRRHAELLGLTAPLLLQDAIASQLARAMPGLQRGWAAIASPIGKLLLPAASIAAIVIATVLGCRSTVRAPDHYTPAAAIGAVESRGITGPVLNAQNFGGYLIFRGYAPFIDGRVDMYGNDFMLRYTALDQLTSLLQQHRIAWTIFEPHNPRTVVMDNLSGWKRIYADQWAVVHVRS
jgi:hypothetical protein